VTVLVVIEHDRGALSPASLEALAAARGLDAQVEALTLGAAADALAAEVASHGASVVHQAHHELLSDYGPEAWGEAVAQAVRALQPAVVLACGTDRGNEVLAQAAARLDLPMVANCVEIDPATWAITRVRWGGSLLEQCTLSAATKLVTIAHHSVEASPAAAAGAVAALTVEIDPVLGRTVVADRVERAAGVTLATAPLVVGGGRAVGSAEKPSPRWRSWPPCSAVSSVARAPSPTTDGATTPTRWGKPAPASLQISTWPAESRGPSSTGWAQWRRRRSSRSTPTRRPTWSPRPTTR
jgi:electron transfer flavoprotein alpha subunit